MSSHRVADMIRPKEHIFPSLHHTDADWSVKRDPEWIIFRFDEIEECNSVWCGEQRYTADVCACIKCSMLSLPESLKSQTASEPWSCTSRSDSREYFASSVLKARLSVMVQNYLNHWGDLASGAFGLRTAGQDLDLLKWKYEMWSALHVP